MYRVNLRHRVQQSLEKLQTKERQKIIEALLSLEQDPRLKGVEKIRGTELWRIRKGDYRIIYHIADEDKVITVVRIGHRRDVYRGI
jgi:mRNA interferase RelE/StbE